MGVVDTGPLTEICTLSTYEYRQAEIAYAQAGQSCGCKDHNNGKDLQASGVLPGADLLPGKVSRKTTQKIATDAFYKARLSDRLLSALGPLFEVNITDARTQLPKMIRSSVGRKVYLIGHTAQLRMATAFGRGCSIC